jgi:hypothetical protein
MFPIPLLYRNLCGLRGKSFKLLLARIKAWTAERAEKKREHAEIFWFVLEPGSERATRLKLSAFSAKSLWAPRLKL